MCCVFWKEKKTIKDDRSLRKHFLFKKGLEKLKRDLDVMQLIRSSRQIKLISDLYLSKP
jgi:hypothetical protein